MTGACMLPLHFIRLELFTSSTGYFLPGSRAYQANTGLYSVGSCFGSPY